MFFSKQKSFVGVDIGTSYIKLVQVSKQGSKPVLDTYGIVNLPEGTNVQGSNTNVTQTALLLRNLLTQARVTTKRCIASLPNSSVFTSVIDMPKMADNELASAMQYEAKKYVPLPFSEVSLSWSVIAENEDATTVKILLIAVPKQIKEMYINIFKQAGLELEIIEIEALALIRSLIIDESKNSVIIDIGAKATGLNFIKGGLLQLTRNLNIGGDTITDRIAQTLNISLERAEQFKKDFGVSGTDFLPEAVKPVLNIIKTEVNQLISIYRSHNIQVDQIILAGGGSKLPGIQDFFKDLGSPTVMGNPLQMVSFPENSGPLLDRFSLQLPIAIGLAIRSET
jgi:type IV pilus assembly protein PilM